MANEYTFPKRLITAQRTFYIQQEVIARLTALEPRPTLIAASKATVPEKLKEAISAARAKQGDAVDVLYDFSDTFWKDMDNVSRSQAKAALQALVKKELDAETLKRAVEAEVQQARLGDLAT
ncbi:hypothetical protein [Nonomuraea sp. NPDC049400]|uniref:hypothetical protein n=1 Tax=Nonomuraea sp. NPDC049400 TaxID=3364352 RepID=UPI0037B087EC